MEDLNHNQVLLLTILVSFVTSIATGIVTVSLMQEAPTTVTQTINRVVERTVEKVIPGETKTVVKEVSTVINVDDLVVEAVKKASPAVMTIYSTKSTSTKVGFAIADGTYVATMGVAAKDDSYEIHLSEKEKISLKFVTSDEETGIALYTPLFPAGTTDTNKKLSSISFSDSGIAPGQTSIALGSNATGDRTLSVGIITSVSGATSTLQKISSQAIGVQTIGGPLIDIHGNLIGINAEERLAISSFSVKKLLDSIK